MYPRLTNRTNPLMDTVRYKWTSGFQKHCFWPRSYKAYDNVVRPDPDNFIGGPIPDPPEGGGECAVRRIPCAPKGQLDPRREAGIRRGGFLSCPARGWASQLLGNWIPLLPQRGRQPTVGERQFPEGNESENINYTDSPATLRLLLVPRSARLAGAELPGFAASSDQAPMIAATRPLLAND